MYCLVVGINFISELWGEGGDTLVQWNEIKNLCDDIELKEENDSLFWSLTADGKYTIKSFYNQLAVNNLNFPFKFLWKVKIPPKIKVFLWLAVRNSVLTKDNLIKGGWGEGSKCVFCGAGETVDHLLLHCSVAKFLWSILQCTFNLRYIPVDTKIQFTTWLSQFGEERILKVCVGISALLWSIWTCKNDICFERKRIIDPFGILHRTCHLIDSWSILQISKESQRELVWGVKLLE